MEESTYVLVHGAWGGAWCWDEFTKDLDGRSVRWRAVDLPSSRVGSDPLSDLAADAAIVTAAASAVEGPVILVGHSYAGAVITEAASHVPNLESLFYIAATVPEVGQSHSGTARLVRVRTLMDSAIRVEGPLLLLDMEIAPLALYQESSPSCARGRARSSRPRRWPVFEAPARLRQRTSRAATCCAVMTKHLIHPFKSWSPAAATKWSKWTAITPLSSRTLLNWQTFCLDEF